MKKRLKGLLSLMMALVMMLAVQVPAMAEDEVTPEIEYVYLTTPDDPIKAGEQISMYKGLDSWGAVDDDTVYLMNPNAYSEIKWYVWQLDENYTPVKCEEVTPTSDNTYTITAEVYNRMKTETTNIYKPIMDPYVEIRVVEKTFDVTLYDGSLAGTKTVVKDCTASTVYNKLESVLASKISSGNALRNTFDFLVYADGEYVSTYSGYSLEPLKLPSSYDYDNLELVAINHSGSRVYGTVYINPMGKCIDGTKNVGSYDSYVCRITDDDTAMVDQLPELKDSFYKYDWVVWNDHGSGSIKETTAATVNTTGSDLIKLMSNYTVSGFYFEAVTVAKDYTIPIYTATGEATGKSVTLNIEDASKVTFPTGIENYGYKLVYDGTNKGTVSNGADVWTKIEAIGTSFDDSKAKIVALEKEVETTTPAEKETTTESDTTVDEKENAKIVIEDTPVVSKDVLESVKGKDENIVVELDNGIEWIINGKDITNTNLKDIDLSIETGAKAGKSIPVDVINKVTGENSSLNLSLNYSGDFGFKATLKINLEPKNKNLYANLYYYNESTKGLEFSCSSVIDSKGDARLSFSHASDYVIVISDKDLNPAATAKVDVKTGTSTRTVIPFVVIAFAAVIGTCVAVTKKKFKEA